VKLAHVDGRGTETILGLAAGGAWLGSASAIIAAPSPASAITCTRTRLQRMPAALFRDLLEQDPALSRLIHREHARDLHRQAAWLVQLTSLSSRERLQRIIRQLVDALGPQVSERGVRVQWPLRHWEMARLLAVTPEHLSRLLAQLQRDGLIQREKGWLIVPDVARLGARAEGGDAAPWGATQLLDIHQDCY